MESRLRSTDTQRTRNGGLTENQRRSNEEIRIYAYIFAAFFGYSVISWTHALWKRL